MKNIDELFELLNIEDQGIKVRFSVNGLSFWFSKQRGMVRLRGVANALFDAQQQDPRGMAAGEYDHLMDKLLERTVYTPDQGDPMSLSGLGYDEFLEHIEGIDETKALQVHVDMPISLALVCLGKSVLVKILSEAAQGASTSPNSGANLELSTNETQKSVTSVKTSPTPAQGLTVET